MINFLEHDKLYDMYRKTHIGPLSIFNFQTVITFLFLNAVYYI